MNLQLVELELDSSLKTCGCKPKINYCIERSIINKLFYVNDYYWLVYVDLLGNGQINTLCIQGHYVPWCCIWRPSVYVDKWNAIHFFKKSGDYHCINHSIYIFINLKNFFASRQVEIYLLILNIKIYMKIVLVQYLYSFIQNLYFICYVIR